MDSFEQLLNLGATTYTVERTSDTSTIDSSIQKADKSANLTDLFKMIGKLVTLTLKDLNVEFVSDDKIHKIVLPDTEIDKNYITYTVKSRKPKDELKPRIRETIFENTEDGSGRVGEIYGQKFKTIAQFNCISSNIEEADIIMERFEELISIYTGYFKKQGIAEILFQEQVGNQDYSILRQNLSIRSVLYYVETERLTVIFREKIKEIETILSQS